MFRRAVISVAVIAAMLASDHSRERRQPKPILQLALQPRRHASRDKKGGL